MRNVKRFLAVALILGTVGLAACTTGGGSPSNSIPSVGTLPSAAASVSEAPMMSASPSQ
jgi:hypothetical protein